MRWQWLTFDSSVGVAARFDDIHNSLYSQQSRERLTPVVAHDIRESSLALYAKQEVSFSRWARLIVGLRADYFSFDVTDQREDLATQGNATSGVRGDMTLSPKATLVVSPHHTVDLFVNFGRGFHSNDARGVVRAIDPVTPLTPALGYEVGARTRLFQRLDLAASLWGLDLDSELVWVGDEGTTDSSGATRRLGFEFEGRLRIVDWLFADLDLTVNDARFTQNAGNGNAVALAPRFTISSGLSAMTKFGLRSSLRFIGIGAPPRHRGRIPGRPRSLATRRVRRLSLALHRRGTVHREPHQQPLPRRAVCHHFPPSQRATD
jgi:outer membrane receptor protein involved in Fe transport